MINTVTGLIYGVLCFVIWTCSSCTSWGATASPCVFEDGAKNYICKPCGTIIAAKSQPKAGGCPVSKSRIHQWFCLGEAGQTPYQCSNCSILVYSKNTPITNGCPKTSLHIWHKLK